MDLNMKDVLHAAAAASSEFVKSLYGSLPGEEAGNAAIFETTITLMDGKDSLLTVVRATKHRDALKNRIDSAEKPGTDEGLKTKGSKAEEEDAEAQKKNETEPTFTSAGEQVGVNVTDNQDAAAPPSVRSVPEEVPVEVPSPYPSFYGLPYAGMPYIDPRAMQFPGAYFGVPYPGNPVAAAGGSRQSISAENVPAAPNGQSADNTSAPPQAAPAETPSEATTTDKSVAIASDATDNKKEAAEVKEQQTVEAPAAPVKKKTQKEKTTDSTNAPAEQKNVSKNAPEESAATPDKTENVPEEKERQDKTKQIDALLKRYSNI